MSTQPVTQQLTLGSNIQHRGDVWRVIRLIQDDMSLFEATGMNFVIKESYAMVKSPEGKIDFIVFASERLSYDGPQSAIKALDVLPWRKQ